MTEEEKMKFGLYEDAPVIRLRIDYILAHFDVPNDVKEQLEDIRDN
jgi:hypothetical protein